MPRQNVPNRPTTSLKVTYTDYLNLPMLRDATQPLTAEPDETVFIVFHHICEKYFELIRHELRHFLALSDADLQQPDAWIKTIDRVTNYFQYLNPQFELLIKNMDTNAFMNFRHALGAASGFQSVQFRMIEFMLTSPQNLILGGKKAQNMSAMDIIRRTYWMSSSAFKQTKEDFLQLHQDELIETINTYRKRNVEGLITRNRANLKEFYHPIRKKLVELDRVINLGWRGAHYGVAIYHLKNMTSGTSGTPYKDYLHPRKPKQVFFPHLSS